MNIVPGYESLAEVLQDALEQAQSGKGKERHAAGEPFNQQEICVNTRAVGLGYPLGQARKKARESKRLFKDQGVEAGVAECLGAINYLAAAVIVMREHLQHEPQDEPQAVFCPGCGKITTEDHVCDKAWTGGNWDLN